MTNVDLSHNLSLPDNVGEINLYNPYAEEMVIMGLLSNPALADYYFSEIDEELFYLSTNKIVFQQIRDIYLKNQSINFVLLITQLEQNNLMEKVGGKDKVINLGKLAFAMSKQTLISYAAILKDKQLRRQILTVSHYLNKLSLSHESYKDINFDKINILISQINQKDKDAHPIKASDIIPSVLSRMKESVEVLRKQPDISTGFEEVDNQIGGLERGNLLIIAGRPSMGKTALGLTLAVNISKAKPNSCIVIFSLEMTSNQILSRLMTIESGIPLVQLQTLQIYNMRTEKLQELFTSVYKTQLYINDSNSMSLEEIYRSLQKVQAKHQNLDLVLIDYLQLLGSAKDNRVQELSLITRSLKNFARTFEVPIITLSQLNRNVEQRSNKRPLLADLRESGCLDPNTLIFLNDHLTSRSLQLLSQQRFFLLYSISLESCQFKYVYADKAKSHGFKHLYQLDIVQNPNLVISANHKVFTKDGWRRLDQLTRHQLIASLELECNVKTYLDNLIAKSNGQNLTFRKLAHICYLRKRRVLDLKISPFANFIANQILVHNSIEQDADIVLLLYREKYYNSAMSPLEDIAEVIIAKNRNGKTGTIYLKFQSEIARFK